jgi:hypothetical protein
MSKPQPNNSAFVFPQQSLSFDPSAFDQAIESQGVELVHWRAMRCPVGMIDRYDSRRPCDDHQGCSNGFVYTCAGKMQALFTSVNNSRDPNDIGVLDGSTVQVTTPRFYDDTEQEFGKEIFVVPFDRFYLAESQVLVEHWQLVESHITGKDKLSFPVVNVVDMIDAKGKRYSQGVEFNIQNGQIVWNDNMGPGFDVDANKGVIYSVRYQYRPFWYCSRVNHQVRVGQIETLEERKLIRFPQSFTLQREQVFEKEQADKEAINGQSPRQEKGSADGAFGPR